MKLSRASLYALRALVYLARNGARRFAAAHTIAAAEGMSEPFLLKALRPVVRGGILLALNGPGGGFRLARPAGAISLLDVVEAVDGPVRADVGRVGGAGGARLNDRLETICATATEAVRRRLRAVSLADLAGNGD
jgi:Rrf2 family protein